MTDAPFAKPTVAFIGTGVMGAAMASHVAAAGYPLVVHNRTRERAESLLAGGAEWAESAGEAASRADIVVTMVGYPADVEEVYLGEGGVVARAPKGAYLIDMTTSTPSLAARVAREAAARGLHALDAPVSGGDVGARNAALTVFGGGDPEDFSVVRPLLLTMGTTVNLMGPAGSGQHAKMANQLAIAGGMLGCVECLGYAKAAGLDLRQVLEAVSAGSAGSWTLANYGPRMLSGDYAPGFYVKHFLKDLRIALDEARTMEIQLPGLELAERLYTRLAEEKDGAELGTQALWLLYGGDR